MRGDLFPRLAFSDSLPLSFVLYSPFSSFAVLTSPSPFWPFAMATGAIDTPPTPREPEAEADRVANEAVPPKLVPLTETTDSAPL